MVTSPLRRLLNQSIVEMQCSVRIHNSLKSIGVKHFWDLVVLSRAQLLATKAFNATQVDEIEDYLQSIGLCLDMLVTKSGRSLRLHEELVTIKEELQDCRQRATELARANDMARQQMFTLRRDEEQAQATIRELQRKIERMTRRQHLIKLTSNGQALEAIQYLLNSASPSDGQEDASAAADK